MIYIYEREDGTRFEKVQSMKDDALTVDSETGQKVKRIITGGRGFNCHGAPSQQLKIQRKQQKALEKDPFHTTMNDYKPENPDSIIAQNLKKNKARLASQGVEVIEGQEQSSKDYIDQFRPFGK